MLVDVEREYLQESLTGIIIYTITRYPCVADTHARRSLHSSHRDDIKLFHGRL